MTKKLKVWGIPTYERGKYERVVVATTTRAQAAKALNVSLYYLDNYAGITGNEYEIKVALENPGIKVFIVAVFFLYPGRIARQITATGRFDI
jgi:hypothetical protein